MKLFKLIQTKYIGPTNHRGSRVKAFDHAGNKITIHWDSALGIEENHQRAAVALIEKIKTNHRIVGIANLTTGYGFICSNNEGTKMKQDKHTTLIIFKKFPDGDVIALMPEDSYQDGRGQSMITSYMRIGQHSSASRDLLTELQDATKRERAALKQELKSLGYNVKEGN